MYKSYLPNDVCFLSPDGKRLICSNHAWATVWDVDLEHILAEYVYPEGDLVALDERIVDSETLELVCPAPKAEFFQFIGNGQLLELAPARRDVTVRDCRSGEEVRKLRMY
ncbi:MAG: hypothetical protein ACXWQO_13745 [Bdellovibrionota bacterium]